MIIRKVAVGFAGLALACSAGGDTVFEPVNRPPTLTFEFKKLGVSKGSVVDLSVSTVDPDGDPVALSWTPTRGTLTPQNAARTVMRWAVPTTVGEDTVVVRATDGRLTTTVSAPLRVCWPANSATNLFENTRSPYLLTLDSFNPILAVDAGALLEIEAGVEILLDTPASVVKVSGRLRSAGSADDPAIIRPNLRDLTCGSQRGWWEGIEVFTSAAPKSDGDVDLDHTELWYAEHGVRIRDSATASVRNCVIRCSGSAGVLHDGVGRLEITGTEISNGRANGIAIGSNVSTGVPDSVLVERNTIEFNERSGLSININDQARTARIVVEYNDFEFNRGSAVMLARAAFPAIHFNRFSGNGVSMGVSNIYLEDGYPNGVDMPTLNATCNYYGGPFTQESSIKKTIRDSEKDPGAVQTRVLVSPWLNENPLTTSPSCTP